MKKTIYSAASSLVLLSVASTAFADTNEEVAEGEKPKAAEKIVVVGSRAAPRSVGDSAVPIDIISQDEFFKNASTDMTNLLSAVVPSFVVNEQPISDAATLVRPANLRGLPPDSTLVLVNGKRRHRAAVISFLGGGISDGAQGPDISVIPNIAIKQVEVLRDGASAQYGSDAIAGVINFQLKDNAEGLLLESRFGEYGEGDGTTVVHSANLGLPIANDGFANFSFEIKNSDATSRSVQRDDANDLIEAGNSEVGSPAQIWGSPELQDDMKFFTNMAVPFGATGEFYLFGNWAQRDVDGGFYFRNPNTRGGVFSNDGGSTLLVGDLDPNDGKACPTVSVNKSVPDASELSKVFEDASCFAFNEMFPGGFTPRFGGRVTDMSLALGFDGELDNGVRYDVSFNTGENDVNFLIRNTVNASLGPNSPTSFNPGRYIQSEDNINLNLSYLMDVKWMDSPLNIAGGLEYREETFEIFAGDEASYTIGPLASQGFGIGSNGFPGFKPEDAGEFSRSNYAMYMDLEGKIVDRLHVGLAVRFEDFEDFGSTTNGKVSARLQMTDAMALRGSLSSGFRAPTVGQANVRNVTTAFTNGELQDEATLPPTNPISEQLGGKPLTPEESTSFTVGSVFQSGEFYLTLDYFNIEVTDRISQTSTLPLSQQDIDELVDLGIEDALSYRGIKFFTNDFDTTTQGIDLIANYSAELATGPLKMSLAMNWLDTNVDSYNPEIISETRIRQLEDNIPNVRGTFTLDHSMDLMRGFVRLNYFGSYYEAHLDDGSLPIEAGAEFTVDMELGFDVGNSMFIALGAKNVFNEYPDEHPYSGIAGAVYPATSPMGFNGGFYYTRLNINF